MVGCSVTGCRSRSENYDPDLSFHAFPSDPDIKQIWIKSTGKTNWEPGKFSKVCSVHFDGTDIVKKIKNKRLVEDAIPKLFVHSHPSTSKSCKNSVSKKRIELPNDMENYMQYKIQGHIKQVRMKKDCVPTKFDCQPNRKAKKAIVSPTESVKKRKKLVEGALKEYEEKYATNSTVLPSNTEEKLITNNKLVVSGLKIKQERDLTETECDSETGNESAETTSEHEDYRYTIIKEEIDIEPEIVQDSSKDEKYAKCSNIYIDHLEIKQEMDFETQVKIEIDFTPEMTEESSDPLKLDADGET